MYRPRHARPSRVRLAHAIPALVSITAVAALGGQLSGAARAGSSAAPAKAGDRSPATAAALVGAFDARPVVLPLPTVPQPMSRRAAARVLLLPATGLLDLPDPRRATVAPAEREAYQRAVRRVTSAYPGCGLSWQLLGAVGYVSSEHGRHPHGALLDGQDGWLMTDSDGGRLDGSTRYDGPVGPLQLLPWTWRQLGATGAPTDLEDGAVAAGTFLCLSGPPATRAGLGDALRAYSRDPAFPAVVLAAERRLAG